MASSENDAGEALAEGPSQPQAILILVGIQGAGKSTFSQSLVSKGKLPWARINQDSISGTNKPGTKGQCLSTAESALRAGQSVVIDRTNLTQHQWASFVALAQSLGIPVHALVLNLPYRLCTDRVLSRIQHEGGYEGPEHAKFVVGSHRVLSAAGLPSLTEGFLSIIVCETPAEVAVAQSILEGWDGLKDLTQEWNRRRPPARRRSSGGTLNSFVQTGSLRDAKEALRTRAVPTSLQADRTPAGSAASKIVRSPPVGPSNARGAAKISMSPIQTGGNRTQSGGIQPPKGAVQRKDALAILMANARQGLKSEEHSSERSKDVVMVRKPKASHVVQTDNKKGANAYAFRVPLNSQVGRMFRLTAQNPARCEKLTSSKPLHVDKDCVAFADKFPKARRHMLIIARDPRLLSVFDLQAEDVPLVRHMLDIARGLARDAMSQESDLPGFRAGFHAQPSIPQLHLHVISQDLDSPSLKTKHHFNTFTTPFFLDLEDWVIPHLLGNGKLEPDTLFDMAAHLRDALRCHRCQLPMPSMRELKVHLHVCNEPYRGPLLLGPS